MNSISLYQGAADGDQASRESLLKKITVEAKPLCETINHANHAGVRMRVIVRLNMGQAVVEPQILDDVEEISAKGDKLKELQNLISNRIFETTDLSSSECIVTASKILDEIKTKGYITEEA